MPLGGGRSEADEQKMEALFAEGWERMIGRQQSWLGTKVLGWQDHLPPLLALRPRRCYLDDDEEGPGSEGETRGRDCRNDAGYVGLGSESWP
jgi:hypothetical protein